MNTATYYVTLALSMSMHIFSFVCILSCFIRVQLCVTTWTIAPQAPLSIRILQARILQWVPSPPPGDLPNPGIEPRSPALQADSLLSEPSGKPFSKGLFRLLH